MSVVRCPFPWPSKALKSESSANDHLKRLLKEHKISEDQEKQAESEIQKITDGHIEKINEILKKKEAEIMEV